MKIGFNALEIDPRYVGGINTYSFGLLNGLLIFSPSKCEVIIFARPANAHLFSDYARRGARVEIVEAFESIPRRILKIFGRYFFSSRAYELIIERVFRRVTRHMDALCDILYTPTTTLFPYGFKKPTVVSMHDIQQVHFPQFFSWNEHLIRKITFGITQRRASYIQTSTDFIKNDLVTHFRTLAPNRVVVIPEGVDVDGFSHDPGVDIFEKYQLPKKFLFFPGQLWPHKNHLTVLKALKLILDEAGITIPLVLTGAKFGAAESIFRYIQENALTSVCYLGKVPLDDLRSLYHRATFLITAVLYESSSLPILEAAASGLPIIASRVGSNIEMSKSFNMNLFDPMDYRELSELILKLWNDRSQVESQITFNRSMIGNFSWENVAKSYLEFFQNISPQKMGGRF